MTLSDGYRRLAALIDMIEGDGIAVRRAEPDGESGGTERSAPWLTATLTVEIPLDGGDTEVAETQTAGRFAAETPNGPGRSRDVDPTASDLQEPPNGDEDPVESTEPDSTGEAPEDRSEKSSEDDDEESSDDSADVPADESVPCEHPECDETFGSKHGMRIHHSKTHRGEDTASHRDPERLREVYEEHDTFAEMRDALGVSVASNTVRRQLIEHGIHDLSANTDQDGAGSGASSDEDAELESTEVQEGRAVSDGGRDGGAVAASGEVRGPGSESVPPGSENEGQDDGSDPTDGLDQEVGRGVTAGELQDTLEGASTVYDVQSALDLDRETTMELLSEVDLLSVVHGRVATKRDRDELRAEIDERIQEYVTGTAE